MQSAGNTSWLLLVVVFYNQQLCNGFWWSLNFNTLCCVSILLHVKTYIAKFYEICQVYLIHFLYRQSPNRTIFLCFDWHFRSVKLRTTCHSIPGTVLVQFCSCTCYFISSSSVLVYSIFRHLIVHASMHDLSTWRTLTGCHFGIVTILRYLPFGGLSSH